MDFMPVINPSLHARLKKASVVRAVGATIRGNRQVFDEKIKYSSFAANGGQTGPGETGGGREER